jgi:phosphoribosylformylglycinamidine synthase subunit PurQ / glutaminase
MSAEPRPSIAIVVFPGSNDDRDAALALESLGADPTLVWHADPALPDVTGVVLPGGFSYGDYLRCGAIARFAPVMDAVSRFAAEGGLVLGICNGFQVLCEAGLLPGALRPNASLSFVCRDVELVVERADTPFTSRCEPGRRLTIPVKHGEGCYFADGPLLAHLEANGQIVLRYADNPNGSIGEIAAVTNEARNVLGLMPHPEHAVDPLLGSADGAQILGSFVDPARERAPVRA